MKNKKYLLFAIILTLLVSAFSAIPSVDAQSGDTTPRTIEVTGEANKYKVPDIATITLGVQTTARSAASAEDENSAIMAVLFDELLALEIDSADMQTSNFYVYQNYNYDSDGNRTDISYNVSNTVRVVVRDLDMLSPVISTVLENGANDIQGISFDLSNREEVYSLVLEQAIKNGMSRAEVMAGAVDSTLGEVLSISSSIYGGGYTLTGDVMAKNAYSGLGGGGETPISSGEINISVTVVMIVEME